MRSEGADGMEMVVSQMYCDVMNPSFDVLVPPRIVIYGGIQYSSLVDSFSSRLCESYDVGFVEGEPDNCDKDVYYLNVNWYAQRVLETERVMDLYSIGEFRESIGVEDCCGDE